MNNKKIGVLIRTESVSHSAESILFGDNKFKIVAENGNSYSRLTIYIYTKNGDLAPIANEWEIPDYKDVLYYNADLKRKIGNAQNITAAEEYIKRVYN